MKKAPTSPFHGDASSAAAAAALVIAFLVAADLTFTDADTSIPAQSSAIARPKNPIVPPAEAVAVFPEPETQQNYLRRENTGETYTAPPARTAATATATDHMRRALQIYESIPAPAEASADEADSGEQVLAYEDARCNGWQRGSINYRQCRASIARSLQASCRELRFEAQQMTNNKGPASYHDICYAADHYQVID